MPDILGTITWTPPTAIVFGEFSGTPNRYKFISTSSRGTFVFYAAQNQAGTLRSHTVLFAPGIKYHLEVIPQYLGWSFFNAPMYFDGKAAAIDITTPTP